MSSFLSEAKLLAEYTQEHPGNTMAVLDFFSLHPEYRLALETLNEGQGGCMFEEVDNEGGCNSLPFHIRGERGYYISRIKDAVVVQELLELLASIYDSDGVTSSKGLKAARRSYMKLVDHLDGDYEGAAEQTIEYLRDLVGVLPRLDSDEDISNDPSLKPEDCTPIGGAYTRQVIRHAPNGDYEKDWIQGQHMTWKLMFFGMRKCQSFEVLKKFNSKIRDNKKFSKAQINVLWDCYFDRKNYLLTRNMSITCVKILKSLNACDANSIGRAGACLFNWSKGFKFEGRAIPSPLHQGEWTLIWEIHAKKKIELSEVK